MPSISEIIHALELQAPLTNQEEWDNSGFIIAPSATCKCSGVMLSLDVTPSVVEQAIEKGCNLIISHHPLIFKGIKSLDSSSAQGRAIISAVKHNIAVYSSHTALDNAPEAVNVSAELARLMDCKVLHSVSPTGTGVLAESELPITPQEFCERCLGVFNIKGLRHSPYPQKPIQKIVFASGSCGFLIPEAIALKADAIVTSDVRYHDFLDFGKSIFIVDLTHFDTEKCTKQIFKRIISQNFTNFAHIFCADEHNPIEYM